VPLVVLGQQRPQIWRSGNDLVRLDDLSGNTGRQCRRGCAPHHAGIEPPRAIALNDSLLALGLLALGGAGQGKKHGDAGQGRAESSAVCFDYRGHFASSFCVAFMEATGVIGW
jgi:hypothetical protein